jgi:tetratricopeptide (TPR) repeat protein
MRPRLLFVSTCAAAVFAAAAIAPAQDWKGRGRVDGVVKNEKGEPVADATVKLRWGKSGKGGPDVKTDAKGKWSYFGLAGGPWDLDFEASGYRPRQIQVSLSEGGRNETVIIALEPEPQAAPAPAGAPAAPQFEVGGQKISAETKDALEAGNAALASKNWTAARENYVRAAAELPDNGPLLQRIAMAYLGEKNKDEALRYAKMAAEKSPQDPGPWQIIAEVEIEKGNAAAGLEALSKIPPEKIVDNALYLNAGVHLYNKKQLAEAEAAFDKAIAVKPDAAAYYYRGLTRLQEKNNAGAKADLQKALELDPKGADANDIKDLLKTIP